MAEKTPWAVLLCKWKGTTAEPRKIDFFQRLFTSAGIGTNNMVDFFDQMSHGAIDVSGSQVFGWFTLTKRQSEYAGNVLVAPVGQVNRQGLVDLARQTAIDNGVDLGKFYGVVVCMNTLTDLFGGGGRQALCDPGSFRPAVLGQEMGHGYGLSHSRRDGSTADYMDPWDTMSTWDGCYISPHPEYTEIGPALNAANMRGRGWLDESRVWFASPDKLKDAIELRPLHRRDLPGFLAAEMIGADGTRYLLELRLKDQWDAAIPQPAVLVHRFTDNSSYLMASASGSLDLAAGDEFATGGGVGDLTAIVQEIDAKSKTATLIFHRRRVVEQPPARPLPPWERVLDMVAGGGFEIPGGGPVDGGGYVVINGRIIRVSPWNPMLRILEQIGAYQAAEVVTDSNVQTAVRRTALLAMGKQVETTLALNETLHSPAPRIASMPGPNAGRSSRRRKKKRAGAAL